MKSYLFVLAAISLITFGSCKKDKTEPQVNIDKIKITETQIGDTKVTLYADQDKLSVGFNAIYFTLEDASGIRGDFQTTITVNPLMDMHSMEHSSPAIQPTFDPNTKMYQGAVVFTMPSGEMGSWKLELSLDGLSKDLEVMVHPAPANTKPVGSYQGTDGNFYVISLIHPSDPKIGINDLLILVNRRASMHSFPAVSNLSIEMEPEMPSMGHGSPNNEHPAAMGDGIYKGKVNFTMTGDWRLHFKLSQDEEVLVEDAFLDLMF